jgi:FkbM family methyltransferase
MPGGELLLSGGKRLLDVRYWLKYKKYRELGALPWAFLQSRDSLTRRVLTNRLRENERAAKYLPVHLRGIDGPLLARPGSTDRRVIKEIFGDSEYRPIHGWTYRSVLDCGANGGAFAAYAQSQGSGILQAYIGVEPDPESFEALSEMVRVRGMESISSLYQVAVAASDGTASFDVSGDSWLRRLADGGAVQVKTLTVNSILDLAGITEVDLLKLDIEGGEKQVLETWPTWRDRVRCVVVELHDTWDSLDFGWFASLARASGFVPLSPGMLFGRQPAAVREDVY